MLALLRANPDTFLHSNLNGLLWADAPSAVRRGGAED